jgi:serine/threonine-protein kinase
VELSAGTVVAERFRLVRQLGEGGMGAVWLAHHVKLDTPCAVKFIHADVASGDGVRERFEREAKIAAQIRSPHVANVLDYGVFDGVPYIGMEYLDGEDLSERLAARGRLTPEETVHIVAQVARALTKAHAAGLVHRDLKPENVFLVRDDDADLVKVLDFGIAKAQVPMPDAKTRTGTLLGTPRFMSPEQAQGSKSLDHRSDLWSLGVIAYRCVVGELPFDSEALGDLLMRIIVHPLPIPSQVAPGLPPSFDAWWQRAAARDPAQRFQSAKELAEALATAFGFAPTVSGPLGAPSPVRASAPSMPSSGSGSFSPPAGSMGSASTMGGAATMLPGGATPSYASGATPPPPTLVTPDHTMSPASRTFGGAEPKKRSSPLLLVGVGMLVGVLGVVAVAFVALRARSGSSIEVSASVHTTDETPAATVAASAAAAPSVELAATAIPAYEAPSASVSAAAPPAPASPPSPPPPTQTVKKPVVHSRPPVTPPPPPAPTRTGKVKLAPPPG